MPAEIGPQQAASARIDALLCRRCDRPTDLCPCNPHPLPQPVTSTAVRRIQRAQRAEHDIADTAPSRSTLFPSHYTRAAS